MEYDHENQLSEDEIYLEEAKEFSKLVSSNSALNENSELNCISKVKRGKSLYADNAESEFHEQNASIKIIESHSEPDLYSKVNLLDSDAEHICESLVLTDDRVLCVSPLNNKSKFKEVILDENKHIKMSKTPESFNKIVLTSAPCQNFKRSDPLFAKSLIERESKSSNTFLSMATVAVSSDCDLIHTENSRLTRDKGVVKKYVLQDNSVSSFESNNAIGFIEYMLNYKPKSKYDNKKQLQDKNIDLINFATPPRESKPEMSNINTLSNLTPEVMSPKGIGQSHNQENKLEKVCFTPGNFKVNKNITKLEQHFEESLTESKQKTPNIKTFSSIASSAVSSDCDASHTDDNFLIIDNQVEKLCTSPSSSESSDEHNNTLEFIEYILNYEPKDIADDKEQILDKNIDLNLPETTEFLNRTHIKSTPNQNTIKWDTNFGTSSIESKPNMSNIKISSSTTSATDSSDCDAIYIEDNIFITNKQVEKQCVSPGSSESSEEINNTLEFIEYMLNYKPKDKEDDKKQTLDKDIDLNLPETTVSFNRTQFKSTPNQSTRKCGSNFDTPPVEYKPTTSNIKIFSSLASEAVSPDCGAVQADNTLLITENQVKLLNVSPEYTGSNEFSNQNIKNSDTHFAKPSMECKLQPFNINTSSETASATVSSDCDAIYSEDNFHMTDKQAEKQCDIAENLKSSGDINNTLEFIEYMLNYKPKSKNDDKKPRLENDMNLNLPEATESFKRILFKTNPNRNTNEFDSNFCTPSKESKPKTSNIGTPEVLTPKCIVQRDNSLLAIENRLEKLYVTPGNSKSNEKRNENLKKNHPNFAKPRTPTVKTHSPFSIKTPSAISVKKTPTKTNMYNYISSPVAAYIHNSPQVPLVKDVYPKKPLPSTSSEPEFIKNPGTIKPSNKENINLPLVAYRSAKKTKVIEIPDINKLPTSQWVKHMTSLSKPTVMKHIHREVNLRKKQSLSEQDESYGNLPLVQADVSICTQKTAFKLNKH